MSVALSVLRTRVRGILRDKTTRPDATAITPFWSDTEVNDAINAAVEARSGLITQIDPRFYLSTKTYTGITDAITGTSSEQYKLPGCESDASSIIKQWVVLRRSDLETYPALHWVEPDVHDPVSAGLVGLFDGLFSDYPENLFSSSESVSIISSTRFRIKPAPAETTYTYKLWYIRQPTSMVNTDALTMDAPDDWKEVICYDAAIELKTTVNAATVVGLARIRDQKLADRLGDKHGRNAGRAVFGNVRM